MVQGQTLSECVPHTFPKCLVQGAGGPMFSSLALVQGDPLPCMFELAWHCRNLVSWILMLNRHTTEWKGPSLGFTADYEGVTAACSQGITAVTQGNCLSLLWNISRLGENFPELSHAAAWHSSWVTYSLPFFISWKMGCSSLVQVPHLDASCSHSPPWTSKLRAAVEYSWAVQEHFGNWIAPSFDKSPFLYFELE